MMDSLILLPVKGLPMHHISRKHIQYAHDKSHVPILSVNKGDYVVLETYDARTGTIQSDTDLLDHPHPKGANPVTGPLYINEAEPGDSLEVHIMDIKLADEGFLAVKKEVGLLAHRAHEYATKMIPIFNNEAQFSPHVKFPIRPMVGTIGTAPAGDAVETSYPGPHGGNMDNNEVKVGAKVHLPVHVPGALLALGDVHASMGDGEVSMVGFEICAEVTIRAFLWRGKTITRPWIETEDGRWVTTGEDLDPTVAMRMATEEMVNMVMHRLDLSFEEAYMLITARGDLAICQACQPGSFPVTTRMTFDSNG
jgi:amidase